MAYGAICVLVVGILGIIFYNRFYQKSTVDTALIRTGAGGCKVLIDGGCLALPFLHQVQKVNMRAAPVAVQLTGTNAPITSDRLRVDLEMEFLIRIDPSPENILLAAQALGSRATRSDELSDFIAGHLIDAMQSTVATYTMDGLHEDRQGYVTSTQAIVEKVLARLGLVLEATSLRRVDQAPFSAFDENNAFNAVGMRRLTEIISENRKQRVQIETETEVVVQQSQLEQTRRQLEMEQQQKQYEAESRQRAEELDSVAAAEIARLQAESERAATTARIETEQSTKAAEIARDHTLRQREMDAMLDLETKKIDHAIAVSAKRAEETVAQADSEAARAKMVEVTENVQTQKDLAIAERARQLALLKAQEDSAVEQERTQSQVSGTLAIAQAEADAEKIRAAADKERRLAESEGQRALIRAENESSAELMAMKLKMHQLDRMPEIVTQMMKPVEKIDSIRINHLGGLSSSGEKGDAGPLNQAMESILGMAVQLPALKGLGAEIGLDFDANLAGRVTESANRAVIAQTSAASSATKADKPKTTKED